MADKKKKKPSTLDSIDRLKKQAEQEKTIRETPITEDDFLKKEKQNGL